MREFAKGVDVLVHEALFPRLVAIIARGEAATGRANIERIMADILDYHTTPVEAAEIARDAGARSLIYYHVVPPSPSHRSRRSFSTESTTSTRDRSRSAATERS